MIQILSAENYSANLKATVQKTGKLGFTEATQKSLGLSDGKYIKFAQDSDKGEMYIAITDHENKDSFKVCKAGAYYYLGTKLLFDALGYDYLKKTIMFDLKRDKSLDEELQGDVYKMIKREIPRKLKKEEDM